MSDIRTHIDVTIRLVVEGPVRARSVGGDRLAEFLRITVVGQFGQGSDRMYWSGRGNLVKKSGQVGQSRVHETYASLRALPESLQAEILEAFALATDRVSVTA